MHDVMVDGSNHEVGEGRTLVSGTGYDIVMGRTLVEGTGYDIKFGILIEELPIGSSVYGIVDGSLREFLIVHHGNPSVAKYHDSCDGTWLLMKDGYEQSAYYSGELDSLVATNTYDMSDINTKLSGPILAAFDEGFQEKIKNVKIPIAQVQGAGDMSTDNYSYKTLDAKLFILSHIETGGVFDGNVDHYQSGDGATLDYFYEIDASAGYSGHSKRVAYFNGAKCCWWTRSPTPISEESMKYQYAITITDIGSVDEHPIGETIHTGGSSAFVTPFSGGPMVIRPACIVPGRTRVRRDTYEIIT